MNYPQYQPQRQRQPQPQQEYDSVPQYIPNYTSEEEIKNIVGQIDPQRILDNLNHSLKGEMFDKESGTWIKIGEPLINDIGRGWLISWLTPLFSNASTMGIIQEKILDALMEGTIMKLTKNFRCNLEKFGFVPEGSGFAKGIYENKGTPDTSRMDAITEMIYAKTYLIYSRSLKGSENKRIFKSLTMNDNLGFNNPEEKKGWMSRLVGR